MKVKETTRVRYLPARSFELRAKAWSNGQESKPPPGAQNSPKGFHFLSPEIYLWAGWRVQIAEVNP